ILHLGCGSFHRAHQALLTQQAIEAELDCATRHGSGAPPAWGIVASSLISPRTTNALAQQDGLYTVLERGPSGTRASVVGTLRGLVYAPDEPLRLRQAFADPAIRIVTVTVTTAGYCTDPATGRLDAGLIEVQRDLRLPYPRTAIGVLVDGLRQRYLLGMPPPVVLSCDNLPSNGSVLRRMCIDFAALHDDRLAHWIENHVQFPATMVDRIVPLATAQDREDATAGLGLTDAVPVSAEPFRQWVIEHFHGPRPRWDAAGAEYVPDVTAWEASKLRLLNGGHLAVACLGALAGCTSVADAMAVPGFTAYALRFMLNEQKPTLPPSNHDIDAYARQLLARWRNASISHQLDRVRRDGSAKLPTRLLAALRINREAGRPVACTLLAVAAWMLCAAGRDDTGRPIAQVDHLSSELTARAAAAGGDPSRLVDLLLELPEVFGEDLPADLKFRHSLQQAVATLQERGARGAVAACVAGRLFDGV
ncbi:MAG TPA: mannitol dehydrogenase family protein, partial [Lautropia sp.]|nr:mannitol dehydrogenase family protein [Lautropia sp.]